VQTQAELFPRNLTSRQALSLSLSLSLSLPPSPAPTVGDGVKSVKVLIRNTELGAFPAIITVSHIMSLSTSFYPHITSLKTFCARGLISFTILTFNPFLQLLSSHKRTPDFVKLKFRRLYVLRTQNQVRFQVLTAVSMKLDVFWDVAQCSLAKADNRSIKHL
jgi:hypothetical protein